LLRSLKRTNKIILIHIAIFGLPGRFCHARLRRAVFPKNTEKKKTQSKSQKIKVIEEADQKTIKDEK